MQEIIMLHIFIFLWDLKIKNTTEIKARIKNKTWWNLYQKIILSAQALKNSITNSDVKNKNNHKLETTHENLFFLEKT